MSFLEHLTIEKLYLYFFSDRFISSYKKVFSPGKQKKSEEQRKRGGMKK